MMDRARAVPLGILPLALVACMGGSSGDHYPAPAPRIADFSASPNPARAGQTVEVSFVVWDGWYADSGSAGEWWLRLSEAPPAGGWLSAENVPGGPGVRALPCGSCIKSSPVTYSVAYVTAQPTRATFRAEVYAYGKCGGVLCTMPFNYTEAELSLDVLPAAGAQ